MKKKLVLIIFMVVTVPLYVLGQGYTIVGEIKGHAEGQTVVMRQIRDLQQQPVDVAVTTVKDGKFTLQGSSPFPEFCMLFVGDKGPMQFFVENSDIRIVVDLENIGQSTVSGSKENDLFMEFMVRWEKFGTQETQLNDTYVSLNMSGNLTQEILSGLQAQMQKISEGRVNYINDFVITNTGRITSAFIVYNFAKFFNILSIEPVANGFDAKTEQSQWVKWLKDNVASTKRTEIGQPFTDVTLKTPDDQPISISDYAGKGKYVLLDFWAGWCGPCRNANPHLVRIYNQYKDKGFEIVGISLDRSKDVWVKAIKDDNLIWPQMSDVDYFNGPAAKLYSVNAIPHMILLDKEGRIIAKGLHVGTLGAKLAEIFGEF